MALSLKKELFTFTKAQTSAIFATACDYAVRLIVDKVVGMNYLVATAMGAVTGAVVNCVVNYNFAFRGNSARKRDVAWRYLFTWVGSIVLNTSGTAFFHEVVGLKAYFAMLLTSFLVAICWNYGLQRSFVYRAFRAKNFSMTYRDFFQKEIYRVIDPFIRAMLRLGITPNVVTFVGFVGNVCATGLFVVAATGVERPLTWLGWGGAVILFAGLFDMMDGRLARVGGLVSRFGAFWDSTLDRYSELLSLAGIVAFFFSMGDTLWGVVTLLALVGSIMVSYVRARAEALGIECKVGIMQRPERVVLLALGTILTGILQCLLPLYIAVGAIALLANYTAWLRVYHSYKQLR